MILLDRRVYSFLGSHLVGVVRLPFRPHSRCGKGGSGPRDPVIPALALGPLDLDCFPNVECPNSRNRVASKKTEGLELGAVDKLLVGIFVGCDGKGETFSQTSPVHPIYSHYVIQ